MISCDASVPWSRGHCPCFIDEETDTLRAWETCPSHKTRGDGAAVQIWLYRPPFSSIIPKVFILYTWIPRRVHRLFSESLTNGIQNWVYPFAHFAGWGSYIFHQLLKIVLLLLFSHSVRPDFATSCLRPHKTVSYSDFTLMLHRTWCTWQYFSRPACTSTSSGLP